MMDALTFLERADKTRPLSFYVVHGDEVFLERLVLQTLRKLVLGDAEDAFGVSTFPGDKAEWATVLDEVRTLPFLGPRRLVIVEQADSFVSRERARLEKFVATLDSNPLPGVLVLSVQTWAANTKLAKAVPDNRTIVCKTPSTTQLPEWCMKWCAAQYGKQLAGTAARLLVDLVGPQMGLLDQELSKLAAYAGSAGRIDAPDVDHLVGQSRTENTWKIFDLIGEAKPGEAVAFLDRLLDQGEEPIRLLGAFSMQLRRVAQAARLCVQGVALSEALERAQVPPFGRRSAEKQLRHLGKQRLNQIFDWLLAADMGLKGSSQLPPRLLLERLVVQLARPRT
jgi:DNA polymerase-3 subunit delta